MRKLIPPILKRIAIVKRYKINGRPKTMQI